MSDAGIIEALQAQIVSTIQGSDEGGVAAVIPAMSAVDAIELEESRFPVIGVAYKGWEREGERPPGSRQIPVITRWEVVVVARDEGEEAPLALEFVTGRLAVVRDRLHWTLCSQDPFSRYHAAGEEVDNIRSGVVAGIATYLIRVRFGI